MAYYDGQYILKGGEDSDVSAPHFTGSICVVSLLRETNRNCNFVDPAHGLQNPGIKSFAQVIPRMEQLIMSKAQYRFHPAVNGGMGWLIDVSP